MENPKPVVGIVLYPFAMVIDFANPQTALAMFCETQLLWKTLDPLPMDSGFSVVPTTSFAQCPEQLDVLLVPGGFGSNDAMQDQEIIAFLKDRGAKVRFVTSVCSGSLIPGAAGLLEGYNAATHWAVYQALEAMNVEAVHERVVVDRNRITGGGVTAGLDFGLSLLACLRDEDVARVSQLLMEYDPQPPFNSGHQRNADSPTVATAMAIMEDFPAHAVALAKACLAAKSAAA
jgi:cyclohexyl-isocyanide hydratase